MLGEVMFRLGQNCTLACTPYKHLLVYKCLCCYSMLCYIGTAGQCAVGHSYTLHVQQL